MTTTRTDQEQAALIGEIEQALDECYCTDYVSGRCPNCVLLRRCLTLLQAGTPTAQTVCGLKLLIAGWRREAAIKDSFHAVMGIGWKVCADDLDAFIATHASPGGLPETAEEKGA